MTDEERGVIEAVEALPNVVYVDKVAIIPHEWRELMSARQALRESRKPKTAPQQRFVAFGYGIMDEKVGAYIECPPDNGAFSYRDNLLKMLNRP